MKARAFCQRSKGRAREKCFLASLVSPPPNVDFVPPGLNRVFHLMCSGLTFKYCSALFRSFSK